jgi:hypothetical protein
MRIGADLTAKYVYFVCDDDLIESIDDRTKARASQRATRDPLRHGGGKRRMATSPQVRKKAIAYTFRVFAIALEFGSEQIIFPLCTHDQN